MWCDHVAKQGEVVSNCLSLCYISFFHFFPPEDLLLIFGPMAGLSTFPLGIKFTRIYLQSNQNLRFYRGFWSAKYSLVFVSFPILLWRNWKEHIIITTESVNINDQKTAFLYKDFYLCTTQLYWFYTLFARLMSIFVACDLILLKSQRGVIEYNIIWDKQMHTMLVGGRDASKGWWWGEMLMQGHWAANI